MKNLTLVQVNALVNQAIVEILKQPVPELESNMLLPRGTNGVSRGADSFTWWEMSKFGMAKIVDRYAKDLPSVSIGMTPRTAGVNIIGDSFCYTIDDLENAAFAGVALNNEFGTLARDAANIEEDRIALHGDKTHKHTGFVNDPNIAIVGDLTGSWAGGSTTGDQIVKDFRKIVNTLKKNSNNSESPDSVAIASNVYGYLDDTRLFENGEGSILDALKKKYPSIKNWYNVECLNGAGVGGADRIVLYTKNPSCVMNVVPVECEFLPEQWAGYTATVNTRMKVGGCIFKRKLSAVYADVNPNG